VRFRILGTLEVFDGTAWRAVPTTTARSVLATLLIRAHDVVLIEQLVFELWGDGPPKTAVTQVHRGVMRLRRAMGDDDARVLVRASGGYRLAIAEGDLDAKVFTATAERGHLALRGGHLEQATELLDEALALWRGPALADAPETPLVIAEANRLAEQRLAAWDARVDADLELGRHATLISELQQHVAKHPLREQSWRQLMVALSRNGRQAEALQTFQRLRRILIDEVGVEPCAELQQLHRQLLAGEPAPTSAKSSPPQQLPAAAALVGRAAELDALDELLLGGGPAVVAGVAGVGKTALALHWAHRQAHRFPDGQLYVNLRGYDTGPPAAASAVLAQLLHILGAAPDDIPADEDQRAAQYRTLLAGKRVLLLLDNASNPDQVRPLLPGPSGCATVITSRDDLRGLTATHGVRRLSLAPLSHDDAVELLTGVLGADRAGTEFASVRELARLCGHLPLALRIIAANLAASPHRTVADQVSSLGDDRLSTLAVAGDPDAAVRAAFDLSYAALPEPARAMFGLLGLVPGQDFGAAAAAALASITARQAAALLDELAAANMLEPRTGDRYVFHDLVRLYARERAGAELSETDQRQACQRLLSYYLEVAESAAKEISPQRARIPPAAEQVSRPELGYQHALSWLDTERDNLIAAIQHAAEQGFRPLAVRLAYALYAYLFTHRLDDDWLSVARIGLAAAIEDDDLIGQGAIQLSVGHDRGFRGLYAESVEAYVVGVELCRRAGWRSGESMGLVGLASAQFYLGQLADAMANTDAALAIATELGSLLDQARALVNLGYWQLIRGWLRRSARTSRRALDIYREMPYKRGWCIASDNHAMALRLFGQHDAALDILAAVADTAREVDSKHMQACALAHAAACHLDAGRLETAHACAEEALAVSRAGGDHDTLIDSLTVLGRVLTNLDRHTEADEYFSEVLAATTTSGFVVGRIDALIAQSELRVRQSRSREATTLASEALTLSTDHEYGLFTGRAHGALATALAGAGQLTEAINHAELALDVHRRNENQLGATQVTALLERLRSATPPSPPATAHRQAARS
jgi:DNA-binding SARP family transcriptional activator